VLISKKMRHSNIAEYIIYLWQTEEIIRAFNLDIDLIERNIIEKSAVDILTKNEIRNWYLDLIQMMVLEKIEKSGHLQILINRLIDLNDLHLRLLKMPSEIQYRELYNTAYPFLRELEQKSPVGTLSEIELSLNGLYGVLLLKINKKAIADSTLNAVKTFSELLAFLSLKYIDFEKNPELFL